jgi:hypothetical protein
MQERGTSAKNMVIIGKKFYHLGFDGGTGNCLLRGGGGLTL